ncbi:MAG: DUF364 domain-containing protein [Peptostreptococcales bacterium]
MIIDNVLDTARPYLENRTITDAVIGLSLIGIELDNGNVGLSYMLREDLPSGCSTFGFAQELIGMKALDGAILVKEGKNDAEKGVGLAILNAASRQQKLIDIENHELFFGIDFLPSDIVGMIGLIAPVAERLAKKVKKLIIFDKAISDKDDNSNQVYKMEEQSKLLPECDIVLLSGTTVINNTIDGLLKMCSHAREIVMVGSSTPMYPEAFKNTGVTVLAGAWWNQEHKEELFKKISLSGGISHVQKSMIKKAVHVVK